MAKASWCVMKVLMLGWELPPHNSGGLGVACYQMAKALALYGSSIDFVLPYKANHPDTEWMTIHSVTESQAPRDFKSQFAYSSDYHQISKLQEKYIQYLEKYLESNSPDIIHAHDWLTISAGVYAKEKANLPLVVHVHATEFDRSGSSLGNPIIHEIEQNGFLMADRIIAVSNITKAIIVNRYNIPPEKIDVVHNAFSMEQFAKSGNGDSDYRYLEHLRRDGYTVVSTLTRLTVQKGLPHFLRAAAKACERYDKLAFLIAGDGEQRDELIQLSADLGIADRVFFTGFVRGKQWRDAYRISDIFVMSSVSEPFGITALEAAHNNNAMIITRQSGVGEVLNSIFRYDFWDIDKLADQIVGIALSSALKTSLSQNVRHEYNRLSWHDVAKKCLDSYQRARSAKVLA